MNKYLRLFETEQEYETARAEDYEEPWVSLTNKGTAQVPNLVVNYNKTEQEKILEEPLTFNITSAGNIYWTYDEGSEGAKTIYYSKNGGEWTSLVASYASKPATVSVVAEDVVKFKGDNTGYSVYYYDRIDEMYLHSCSTFKGSTCGFTVSGNIMSLIDSSNFSTLTSFTQTSHDYHFARMFQNCAGLTDASALLLPATSLQPDCYRSMFTNCTNLTGAPMLPATTLAIYCYTSMFENCTSLINPPSLPATILADSCYHSMFKNCTGLTTAPVLSATTLATSCYGSMFHSCTNLITPPELNATTLASSCYSNMFRDCTSLTSAPILPALQLVNGCYYYMFYGCSNLNYVKAMFTTTPSSSYTNYWLGNVSSTGTFVKNSAATWTNTGASAVPTNWTIETANA